MPSGQGLGPAPATSGAASASAPRAASAPPPPKKPAAAPSHHEPADLPSLSTKPPAPGQGAPPAAKRAPALPPPLPTKPAVPPAPPSSRASRPDLPPPAPRAPLASRPQAAPAAGAPQASRPDVAPAPRSAQASRPDEAPAPRMAHASRPDAAPAARAAHASRPEAPPAPRAAHASRPDAPPAARPPHASRPEAMPAARPPHASQPDVAPAKAARLSRPDAAPAQAFFPEAGAPAGGFRPDEAPAPSARESRPENVPAMFSLQPSHPGAALAKGRRADTLDDLPATRAARPPAEARASRPDPTPASPTARALGPEGRAARASRPDAEPAAAAPRPTADATAEARPKAGAGPGPSLDDVPDLRFMAEAPGAPRAAAPPERARQLPGRRPSLADFGKLDLPDASAEDADLPAPKYAEADLPSPKLPPSDGGEAEPSDDPDELLPSPLNRPSRASSQRLTPPSSFGVLADGAIDLSAKPTAQTLSGGFLAPGVVRTMLPTAKVPPRAPPPRAPAGGAVAAPRPTPTPVPPPDEARGHSQSQPALVLASAVAPRPVLLPAPRAIAHDSVPPFAPKRRGRVVAALAGLALVALAAALTPLGAGVRSAVEGALAGPGGRQGGSLERAMREAFVTDRADASALALAAAEAAWVQGGRAAEATPALVYAGSLYALRFGPDPGLATRLQGAFERLPGGSRQGEALARAAYAAAFGRDLARAKVALRAMLAADGSNVDVLALAGEAALASGDGPQAVELWTALARLETSPRAQYGLARAFAAVDRRGESDDHARQTLALARDHAGARVLLAQSAWRAGRHDDVALPYALEATQSAPVRAGAGSAELVEAYALLADVHEARGRVGASERAWADALRVDGHSARARIGAGEALYQMGRYTEALEHFEAARPLGGVEAGVGAAKARLALGQGREAHELLRALAREAEERGKAPPKLWTWLGRAELAQGNEAGAEVAFRRAISLSEGSEEPEAHAALAEIHEKRGQLKPALAAWRRALDLDPHRAEWHFRIGRLLGRVGRHDEARTHLYAAVENALAREPPPPWTSDACLLLANSERKAGQLSSATTHYRCALMKR
ncbi:MAG TPA: tetratricopeptide repeat protein [Polyangiaceae bacterium]|nr:tetratricopeptide repeat protein [Polyangiaceae bacterium]